jgi:hypothetical protein
MKNRLSSIKVGLIKNRGNEHKVLNQLKYNYNYSEIKTVIKEILTGRLPGKNQFIKSLFSDDYKEISGGHFLYQKPNEGTLLKELNWNFAIFEFFANQINEFLTLQEQFENELILGNYLDSMSLLKKIESNVTKSIWSMEKRFIQEELQNGLEGNKRFLKEIKKVNDEPLIYFLADFMSFKVEENTTFQQYLNKIKKLNENINYEMFQAYLNYKLNYQYPITHIDVSHIFIMEGRSSLIDRYLTTINMCKHMVINPDFKMYQGHIYQNLLEISKVIDDPNVSNILLYLQPDIKIKNLDHQLLMVSDLYTEGKYKEAMESSENCLGKKSNVFEIYEYYLKSFMYIRPKYEPINHRNNLQNKILESMYYSYTRTGKFHDSFKELLKISIVLGDSSISVKINAFLTRKHLVEFKTQINMHSEMSSRYITPRFSLVFKDREKEILFLENIEKETNHNKTIAFFDSSVRNFDILNLSNIPRTRRNIQLARVLADDSLYEDAIKLLEGILIDILNYKEKSIFHYLHEKVNVLLFNLFLETGQTIKSMEIYIENYLLDPNLVGRMDLNLLVSCIENADSRNLKSSIYTPILSFLHYNNDSTKVYRSYANYMDLNEYDVPSLIPIDDFIENKKKLLIFFLSKVCSQEVLESAVLSFQNEEEIRKERINICQKLLELDSHNEYEYIKEITEITQKVKVDKKLREIDESRIDINIKGIKNDPESVYKENFKRFITSQKSLFDFMILDINDISTISEFNDIRDLKKNIKVQDQSFLLFKEAICDLRDQFAFNSKYGLDSSLSTRIRHGALFNELRKPFEIYNLILSKKNKDIDMYDLSNHWIQNLTYNSATNLQEKLKDALGTFSKKIDQKIELINNNNMRIKTESKNQYGFFDLALYDYDILQVYQHFKNNSTDDSEEFFEIAMQIMWNTTEESLKFIRGVLENDIQKDFLTYLDQLQDDLNHISEINSDRILSELRANIINCRTELQIQIEKISNWFKLSTNTENSDFDAFVLVDTCIETLGNLNKYKNVVINKEVNTSMIFKGYTFTYLIDILNIFINNAMQHSMFHDLTDLIIRISINEENDYVNLTVENNFSPNVDKEVLQAKIQDINAKVNDLEYIKKYHASEGGSGYIKIFKILHYNLITRFKIHLDIKHSNTFHVNISIKKQGLI